MSRLLFLSLVLAIVCLPRLCSAQTDVKVPAKVLGAMKFLAGKWDTEGTYRGVEFKGTCTVRWAPGKHCLIMNSKSGVITGSGVSGWDPTTNEMVETWYRTDGFRVEQRYARISESIWEGTVALQDASGKVKNGQIRLEKGADGKSLVFTGTVEGETLTVKQRRAEPEKK